MISMHSDMPYIKLLNLSMCNNINMASVKPLLKYFLSGKNKSLIRIRPKYTYKIH